MKTSPLVISFLGLGIAVTGFLVTLLFMRQDMARDREFENRRIVIGSPDYPECQWTGTLKEFSYLFDPGSLYPTLGESMIRWVYTCERLQQEADARAPATCTATPRNCS